MHAGERRFICKQCDQRFTQSSNLHRHMLLHTDEQKLNKVVIDDSARQFQCRVCNKKFSTKSDLLRHARIHTGERPFGCDICEKKYVDVSNLRRHRRTHSKEFSVDQQQQAFNKNSFLSTEQCKLKDEASTVSESVQQSEPINDGCGSHLSTQIFGLLIGKRYSSHVYTQKGKPIAEEESFSHSYPQQGELITEKGCFSHTYIQHEHYYTSDKSAANDESSCDQSPINR